MSNRFAATLARLGAVALIALAIMGTWVTGSISDVSASGKATINSAPTLFGDHGGDNDRDDNDRDGRGDGDHRDGRGDDDNNWDHDDSGAGAGDWNGDPRNNDDIDGDRDGRDHDGNKGDKDREVNGVDCGDKDAMIDYLVNRSSDLASVNSANAENLVLGSLHKCNDDGEDDASPTVEATTPVEEPTLEPTLEPTGSPTEPVDDADSDEIPGLVTVDLDENGNGTISFDLDRDGEFDLILTLEDGKIVDVEVPGRTVQE